MARNKTLPLHGNDAFKSDFYARIIAAYVGDSDPSVVEFTYKGETRVAHPIEIVGTPGTSTYGFKGETDKGVRTFTFHYMEGAQ